MSPMCSSQIGKMKIPSFLCKSSLNVAKPDVAQPDVAQPDVDLFDVAQPDVAKSDVDKPDVAEPDVAQPYCQAFYYCTILRNISMIFQCTFNMQILNIIASCLAIYILEYQIVAICNQLKQYQNETFLYIQFIQYTFNRH